MYMLHAHVLWSMYHDPPFHFAFWLDTTCQGVLILLNVGPRDSTLLSVM
jgi:hypothetical protein